VTRLGEGLAASGVIAPEPGERTAAVVAAYVRRAEDAGAETVRIVATSAVRTAANGPAFAAALAQRTGYAVEVVSGEEEARLTVLGILQGLAPAPEPMVAFDVGGGSTEVVLARAGRVVAAQSLALGVVPLAERYPFPGPVEAPRWDALRAEVRARLTRELIPAVRSAGVAALVGTAGTVTTLAALDLGLEAYDARRVHGHRLGRAALARLRARLGALTLAERAALPCLEPGRADLIVPGLAIVEAVLEVTGAHEVLTSDWGLREGVVADTLARAPGRAARRA